MRIENPVAFSFLLQDDIYLLPADKPIYPREILPEAIPIPLLKTPMLSFNYYGSYKKHFLITVFYPGLEVMLPAHLEALEKTLKSLGFSFDDAAILNLATYPDTSLELLNNILNPQKLLIMGQQALPAGSGHFLFNQPKQVNNCRVLFTFSFEEMMDSTENKKRFWEQMKLL